MAIKSFNRAHETLAQLKNALARVTDDLYDNDARFAALHKDTTESFDDSRTFWSKKTWDEQCAASESAGKTLSQIDSMIEHLNRLDNELSLSDKTYLKRKNREFTEELRQFSFSRDMDYIGKLNLILREAMDIARSGNGQIGMTLSGKRRQMQERFYNLVLEGKKLREFAYDTIQSMVYEQRNKLETVKKEEIDKAADETASLIQRIEQQKAITDQEIAASAGERIKEVLSAYDIDTLLQMQEILETEGALPEHFREQILYGEVGISLAEYTRNPLYAPIIDDYLNVIRGQELILPAIYDLRENANFFLVPEENSDEAKEPIHSVIFSLLKNAPASKQLLFLYDPEGHAKGFDVFLEFIKRHPDIAGGRILTTQDQIKEQIHAISNYIDEAGQKKYVGYKDIFEYNANVPDKQEALKCLCILNFPRHFNDAMLDELCNIIRNGTNFGVMVLLQYDNKEVPNHTGESYLSVIDKIRAACIELKQEGKRWVYPDGVWMSFSHAPTQNDLSEFDKKYSAQYENIKNAALSIEKVTSKGSWFTGDSSEMLSIPIGKNEKGEVQNIEFGDPVGNGTSHYALIVGSLGSGKSTLLHTIIMSAITKYSPDELNIYLMDFKSGTEFKVYAERNIPHIKLIALDAMQEFGQSILDELWNMMQERSRLFKDLMKEGINVKDITQYRKMTGRKLPRILVVVDEFQILFSEDLNRKIAYYCGAKIADFISLARVFGIHFILSTQTLSRLTSGFSIRKATLNEMYVRIGLQCTADESNLIFGEVNGKAAFSKMGQEKGSAVYTENYVRGETVAFKVAYCDNATQKDILSEIEHMFSVVPFKEKPKVFEGDSIPTLSDCKEFLNPDPKESLKSVQIYLGEPIKIDEPVRLNVNRLKRNNLLIVGNNHEMSDRLTALYVLNAVKSRPYLLAAAQDTSVYLFDGLTMIGERMSDYLNAVYTSNNMDIRAARDNYDAVALIDEIYDVYEKRSRRKAAPGAQTPVYNTIHIIFNDYQWLHPIKLILTNKSVDEYTAPESTVYEGEVDGTTKQRHPNDLTGMLDNLIDSTKTRNTSNLSYHKKLMTIIESGYTYGMNVVITSPDMVSIKEILYEAIPKFQNRIVYSLNNADADILIQEAKTELLRQNIVIYWDGIHKMYQFKPYDGIKDYCLKELDNIMISV